jgi:hypothetical protein
MQGPSCFLLCALVLAAGVRPVQAQSFCFMDGFGFVWDIALAGCSGPNCSVTGTVDVAGACLWAASGTVNQDTGAAHLVATNQCPDECTFYTDSFEYTGTFVPAGGGALSGAGTWTSYCFGAPLSSGTWTGTMTCGACDVAGAARRSEGMPGSPAVRPSARAGTASSVQADTVPLPTPGGMPRESLAFLAPTNNTLVVGGEPYRVQWAQPADTLQLRLELLPGNFPARVIAEFSSVSGSYLWSVPDTLYYRQSRLRLTDLANPGAPALSEPFRIKPYHLTRFHLTDPTRYEPYDVGKHGWRHANTEANWFPPAWWMRDQFNYDTGFDPFIWEEYPDYFYDAPQFGSRWGFPDWPAYVRAFGEDDAYWSTLLGYYDRGFVKAWGRDHGPRGWGGSCYGIATSSLLAFTHREAFGAAYPRVGPVARLFSVGMSHDVRELVNAQFCYQYGLSARAAQKANLFNVATRTTPRDLLARLKELLLSDDAPDEQSVLSMKRVLQCTPRLRLAGGHAVVPYRLEPDPGLFTCQPGRWSVYVYDPNEPDNGNMFVSVDSTANTWEYDGFKPAWGGTCGLFLRDPIVGYLQQAAVDDPMAPNGLYVAPLPNTFVIIAGGGGLLGYLGGQTFNTIDGANPDVLDVGGPTPPVGYFLPGGTYTLTLTDASTDVVSASLVDGERVYSYGRGDADAAHTDRLAYDGAGGLTARSDDAGVAKRITLSALVAGGVEGGGGGLERVLAVADLALTGADSVRFAVVDDVAGPRLSLVNEGGDKTYTLQLMQSSADGESAFVHAAVPLAAGVSHLVRSDWTVLSDSTVSVDVDADGDGEPDSTLVLQNQTRPDDLVVTLTPEVVPVVIPPGGGSFRFTYAVTNATDAPVTFDAWTVVVGPVERSPVVGPLGVTLPPGATASRMLTQRVPAAAPAGEYGYGGLAGAFPDTVRASSAFTVTKEEATRMRGGPEAGVRWPAAEWGDGGWTITGGEPAATGRTSEALPATFALGAAYPNPSGAEVTIPYAVPAASRVRLVVYDVLGRAVAVLADGEVEAGRYTAVLHGEGLASGVYVVRMTAGTAFTQSQRVTLLR